MINNFFLKIFPFFFVFFFIYFEFSPVYFFENELVKPFLSITVIYSWIHHDNQKFRPIWLLIFGLFYDILQDGIVGITSLFFLMIYHFQRKQSGNLLSFDLKEIWLRFVVFLTSYLVVAYLINSFGSDFNLNLKKASISFLLTLLFFPLFFIFIEKITYRFRGFDD